MYMYYCPECTEELTVLHCTKMTLVLVSVSAGLFGKPQLTEQSESDTDVMYACPHCSEELSMESIKIIEVTPKIGADFFIPYNDVISEYGYFSFPEVRGLFSKYASNHDAVEFLAEMMQL